YLTQLELYLKKLPEADRIEAMDYFRELFDEALLAAPIGIPLGIAILVTLFAILVAALTVILAFFAVSILGIIGGFLFLVESFT
ncbi:HAAS signaling domain-containing protein, partial [Streptococcus pneumoniae]|uniref:HAAS signaling domain-containing protein n=1 Tax=Streptococcus pneumoniae TaxID=1313 RepID=UPI000A439DE5